MPKFYFHIREHGELTKDAEGVECGGPAGALIEAKRAAREKLAQRLMAGEPIDGQQYEVADENGQTVFVLPFKSAIRNE